MPREIMTPARIIVVEMRCNNCEGTMVPTGEMTETYPPRVYHKCEKCGSKELFDQAYPHVKYEKLDVKKIISIQDN